MNITVVGIGYVGLANVILLSQKNNVIALDSNPNVVELLKEKKSHLDDSDIKEFLSTQFLSFMATTELDVAYKNPDFILICTPTNYDEETNKLDTSSIEQVLNDINSYSTQATVIIKSTVPIGYTEKIQQLYPNLTILFSPEFLREGKALYDNLYPSRIIIGSLKEEGRQFGKLLIEAAKKKDIPILYMPPTEAEAVKIFANTYLALRISYINELDTYAEVKGLNSRDIILGMCLDPRIGTYYNNPSFGYGGYCLPKDSKQMVKNYENIPNQLMRAIVLANDTRKDNITSQILKHHPQIVGIYRLSMKLNSDNFREAAIIGIIQRLLAHNIEILIYEPELKENYYLGSEVIHELEEFKIKSNLIVANRWSEELSDVSYKVYTRDIFHSN